MAHIRHPILGDTTHGDGKQNKFLRHHFNYASLALTCTSVVFEHPVSNAEISVSASLHTNAQRLLNDWLPFSVINNDELNTTKVITT
jgi:tRNA pseudouridine65 synthase